MCCKLQIEVVGSLICGKELEEPHAVYDCAKASGHLTCHIGYMTGLQNKKRLFGRLKYGRISHLTACSFPGS